ncbi:MAG: O-antigen ligase family protein [Bacteroidales bacterium]|nr:O-antigen ligase family protein [Bacteroidales bacterium]
MHHYLTVFGLAVMGGCLPLSKYVLTLSMFFLSLNWLAEGNFRFKLNRFKKQKSLWLILSVFLVYILGMIYTEKENLWFGVKRIVNILPMLALPVILGTGSSFSRRELKFVFIFYCLAVWIASLISLSVYFGWAGPSMEDIRDISIFISHLHFSIIVDFAIFILLYMVFFDHFEVKGYEKAAYSLLAIWLIVFVFILRSFLGITIFVILFPVALFVFVTKLKSRILKRSLLSVMTLLYLFLFVFVFYSVLRFYRINHEELMHLNPCTVNGTPYFHDPENKQRENGNHVWINICQQELKKEWNIISPYAYEGYDKKGQHIMYTLIRYLTSKGLSKDSVGIHSLSKEDINLIEHGYANYIFKNKYGLYQRLYQIIWEVDIYFKTGEVHSHSVTQRFEFARLASQLFIHYPFIGVGTGDVHAQMVEQSKKEGIRFQYEWKGKPHNQLLNWAVSFGVLGFCWILFAWIYPVFLENKQHVFLFRMFLLLYLISSFIIDTTDSHVSVSFLAFFYAIFLYSWENGKQSID